MSVIEDDYELRKLIARYTKRGDAFDWKGWADLFTEDAIFTVPGAFGTLRGRREIHDIPKSKIHGVFATTQHYIVNLDFDVQGDTAQGTGSLFYVAVANAAKPNDYYMAGGRYQWSFVRTKAGWLISKAHLDFLWNNGSDAESVFVEDSGAAKR